MNAKTLALLLIVAALSPATAQDRAPAADGLASAVIAGRVVTADTGAPVRGAQVRLRAEAGGDTRLATTDERGYFEARNLFTGSWIVAVSKSGFITARYGQRRSFDEGKPVYVNARQRAEVSVALQRAGAITGRVFDEFGDPLLGARVQAQRSTVVRGVRELAAVGASDTTDDIGAFRLFGLGPGTYYVNAMLRASAPDTDIVQGTLGAMTYYAGTADVGEAQPVALRAGEEANIAFQVVPIRNVRVSGVVLNANGAPAADADVRLLRLDNIEVGTTVGNFGRSGPDGSFSIINVPPGPYVMTASRMGPLPARPQPKDFSPFEEASTPITIGVEDVAGVTLAMTNGITVTGSIVADSGFTLPSPLSMEITAVPAVGPAVGPGRNPATTQVSRAAGQPTTFTMPGMYGPIRLGVNLPDGLMLRAIEFNGNDVTDQPIELRGAAPDVRIIVTNRVTEISGLVTTGPAPVTNGSVIVFSEDQTKWNFPSRYVTFADTDDQGRFLVRRLPPGEHYFAAVVPLLEDGEQFDPELLRTLRDRATSFTLGDGERKRLTLTLDR